MIAQFQDALEIENANSDPAIIKNKIKTAFTAKNHFSFWEDGMESQADMP